MNHWKLEGHKDSLLPDGKEWKLVWNDEFDGAELDQTKWSYRLHLMHQRHNTYIDNGAVLDGNSNLLLPLTKQGNNYYSPAIQTGSNFMDIPPEGFYEIESGKMSWPIGKLPTHKFLHKYGYYECRCKQPEHDGWWSAFWLQSPQIGATLDPACSGVEVDVMEPYFKDGKHPKNKVYQSLHWNGYGPDHEATSSGLINLEETEDGFHVYGVHWTPTEYIFYVDGKETWRMNGPISHCEQFILLTTECMGYRDGDNPDPMLNEAVLPDYFIVDYVRVFDEVGHRE